MSENPLNVDLGEQEPRGCRFVYGDPGVGPWFYCQKPTKGRPGDVSNPPYCDKHRAETYLPQTPYNWRRDKWDRMLGAPSTFLDANIINVVPGGDDGPRMPLDALVKLSAKGLVHD